MSEPLARVEWPPLRSIDDPTIYVYYYDTDLIYYTPWPEVVIQILAESEDSKSRIYFFLDDPFDG